MNYFVPNFGNDHLVKQTYESLDWAQKNLNHNWNYVPEKKTKGPPMNYPVPNFGVDHDIRTNNNNLAGAETDLKHTWTVVPKKERAKPHPTDYFVPNFGVDHDIAVSMNHMEDAEKTYGTWDLPVPTKSLAQINNLRQSENIQLDQSREPLLTWAPKVPKTHPMNYAVPNFGEDGDITNTNNSIAQEEARQKYTWTPKIDPKTETWAYIPTASIEFKLNEGL